MAVCDPHQKSLPFSRHSFTLHLSLFGGFRLRFDLRLLSGSAAAAFALSRTVNILTLILYLPFGTAHLGQVEFGTAHLGQFMNGTSGTELFLEPHIWDILCNGTSGTGSRN